MIGSTTISNISSPSATETDDGYERLEESGKANSPGCVDLLLAIGSSGSGSANTGSSPVEGEEGGANGSTAG
jgi:hypothetical protein